MKAVIFLFSESAIIYKLIGSMVYPKTEILDIVSNGCLQALAFFF